MRRPRPSPVQGRTPLLLVAAVAVLAHACGTGRVGPSQAKPPAQTTMAPPAAELSQAPRSAEVALPESLQRLSSAVDALGPGPGDPHHGEIVVALRELANALELTPDARDRAPAKLREAAEELESSSPSSLEHADMLKEALKIALRPLVSRAAPSGHETEYRDSVEALGRSIDALNADRPLLEQEQAVVAAFRAATDAVYLARGGVPPFGQAKAEDQGRGAVGTIEDELEQAREDVLELGQTKWTNDRQASASALSSIADVVEASDPDRAQRNRISVIRFQAERLRSADSFRFGQAAWVKTGLTTSLDALDAMHADERADEQAIVTSWIRAARRAVGSIEERDSLSFQRAAVQDGFRSTVDAFVVASQSGRLCR